MNTSGMVQLLLFNCNLLIVALDPTLKRLLFSLQREELLSQRISVIILLM